MRILTIGILTGLLVAGVATPVFAHDGNNNRESSREKHSEVRLRYVEAAQDTQETVQPARDDLRDKRSEAKEHKKTHKEQIDQRRTNLKQELNATRTERKSALTEKRLEMCQQRQAKINELVAGSAKMSRARLAHIQKVEVNVKDFYNRKKLASSEYGAASALVDEKEAIAVAAVEVTEAQQFSCDKVDGDNPSGELKTLHTAKREALNDYRDSVKQLIQIVKSARTLKVSERSAS